MSLERGGSPARIWGYLATGNYFDTLGVRPVIGRFFHQGDDQAPGSSPYAVLSYRSWQARFGGDPKIVGETIRINGLPYTILGVAPDGFHGTELFYWPEVWVPMMMNLQIRTGKPLAQRTPHLEYLDFRTIETAGHLRAGNRGPEHHRRRPWPAISRRRSGIENQAVAAGSGGKRTARAGPGVYGRRADVERFGVVDGLREPGEPHAGSCRRPRAGDGDPLFDRHRPDASRRAKFSRSHCCCR